MVHYCLIYCVGGVVGYAEGGVEVEAVYIGRVYYCQVDWLRRLVVFCGCVLYSVFGVCWTTVAVYVVVCSELFSNA